MWRRKEKVFVVGYDYVGINSALHEINSMWFTKRSFCDDDAWDAFRVIIDELEVLALYFDVLRADSHRGGDLWSREIFESLGDFGGALGKATCDIRRASERGGGMKKRAKNLSRAVKKFQDSMALFRPKIKAAFEVILTCLYFGIHWAHFYDWRKFFNPDFTDMSIDFLCRKQENLPLCVKSCLDALPKIQLSLELFLGEILPTRIDGHRECRDLLNHVGASLVHTARSLYSWSIDEMDQNLAQQEVMVNDVLKRLMPTTPEAINMFVKVLKASKMFKSWGTKDAASHFVCFLIPAETEQKGSSIVRLQTFQKALIGLISFLIDAPLISSDKGTDMFKKLLKGITDVSCDFGALTHLLHANDEMVYKETSLALFKLLGKMELLNLEVLLLELEKLMDYKPEPQLKGLKLHMDQESVDHFNILQRQKQKALLMRIPVQDRIHSLHEGLSFLRAFLADAPQFSQVNNVERMKTLWMHIEDLTRKAGFVYNSFCSDSVTEKMALYEIRELLRKINLLKIEVFFMEMLENQPSLILAMRGQVEIFYEGLAFIRTFLMSPLDQDGQLILPDIIALVIEVESLYCSFHEPEDLVKNLNLLLPSLLENIDLVKFEITERYQHIRSTSQSKFPKSSGFDFIDSFLENLRELLGKKVLAIDCVQHHIEVVHNEMEEILESFPRDVTGQNDDESDLKKLGTAIQDVAYQAEYLIDSFSVRGGFVWYHLLWLSDLIEELKLIKIQVLEISKETPDISINNVEQPSTNVISIPGASNVGEIVVDLHDQAKLIIDKLIAGSSHQDVVSIVGMPGLGKTTLAQKVYNDPSVTHHLHIRAWGCVSQKYQKRKLLLDLLSNLIEITDDIHELTADDLDFKLYQCLKQRRYLIVFDDFWSIEPWNDFEVTLPDDNNGSRILITSRLPDVASKTKPRSVPHHLRILSEDESWELLQKKLFQSQDCPDELVEVGKQIVRRCKGLPLAIVAISGLLQRTERTQDWWNQVAESLSSHIVDSAETRCMDILELSYKHLPNHLKPCFLYVGAFLADQEIPVWKLRCLWIAEGFIKKTDTKSLEEVAEEYLKDLIGRSLIMASKRSSSGGVKTCRVHDLLRAMCLVRCKEENFLQSENGYDQHFTSSFEDLDYGVDSNYSDPPCSITYETVRLSIYSKRNHFVMLKPCGERVRSLLFFASTDTYPRCPYDISFIPLKFKLLRVLDLESINVGNSFPSNIEFLVHLRFLSICGDIDSVPALVANLWNLETLLVKGLKGKVVLPNAIWSMVKLRHVHVNNYASLSWLDYNPTDSFPLHNLISLSTPYLYGKDTAEIMRMLPKLRKLRCVFAQSLDILGDVDEFPALHFLTELESLKVYFSGRIAHPRNFQLPLNLKKLTLSKFRLPWNNISEVGKLPNLEVLKLLSRSFEGKIWNMREGEFLKLKFLKLDTLNLAQWNASSDHLPELQSLVVQNCRQLEKIPSGFGEIDTLEMIEIQFCRPSVEGSVQELKEQKLEFGNEEFEVFINGSNWNLNQSS